MKIALAQINPKIGDLTNNTQKIISFIQRARDAGAEMVLFPELAICGYPPEDLLLMPLFIDGIEKALETIVAATQGIVAFVGTVRRNPSTGEKGLYNSAAIIDHQTLVGFQDKSLLPDYDVFSERRYFEPASSNQLWDLRGKKVGVTICEDMWQHVGAVEYSIYPRDPIAELKSKGAEIVVNLTASPYYAARQEIRQHVSVSAAKTLGCPFFVCNQVGGNDSLIFDGCSLALGVRGELLGRARGFEEDLLVIDTEKPPPSAPLSSDPLEDLFRALVLGVRDYFGKLGFKRACFGLSGGIDSALVACIAAKALGSENLLGLTLPSRYSSKGSVTDSFALAKKLGIACQEISIEKPFEAFLEVLAPPFKGKKPDVTEENLQARIRGTLLMAFCNKLDYLLLGSGNKSEMAMGYSTLYGDMCGGLSVLSDVTKAQVYALSRWINKNEEIIPEAILTKAPSAELRPGQKDSDTLPDYAILDVVLQEYVEEHRSIDEIAAKHHLDPSLVSNLVTIIHRNEYKRRQAPPGLRVTKKAFTVGRRFPIVQGWQ